MRKLALVAAGFAIGVAAAEYLGWGGADALPLWAVLLPLFPIFAAALLSILGKRLRPVLPAPLLAAALVLLGLGLGLARHTAEEWFRYRPAAALAGETLDLRAVALDSSEAKNGSVSVEARLLSASRPDGSVPGGMSGQKLLLYLPEGTDLSPGEVFSCRAALSLPKVRLSFDARSYYRSEHIFLLGSCRDTVTAESEVRHSPATLAAKLRRQIMLRLDGLLPDGTAAERDAKAIGLALLTGDRSAIGDGLRLALSLAGLSHITAVSGMHISTLTGAVLALASTRRMRRRLIPAVLLLAFGYGLLTGFSASALRACLMCALALTADLLGRDNDPLTSLSLALLVLLAANPFSIRSSGLLLSFSAALGIVLLCERNTEAMLEKAASLPVLRSAVRRTPEPVLRLLFGTISASWAATLFTLPLSALFFGLVPTLNLVTGLLTLPLLAPILLCGILCAALSFLPAALPARILAWPLSYGLRWVVLVARAAARLPFCALDARRPETLAALVLLYLLLGHALLRRDCPKRITAVRTAALLCLLPLCIGVTAARDSAFCLRVLNVGQGAATCMSSRGSAVLIDCGGDCYGGPGCHTAAMLLTGGTNHLDAVVLTHCHEDHAGGLADLLEFITVDKCYLPSGEKSAETIALLSGAGVEVFPVERETAFSAGGISLRLCRPLPFAADNSGCLGAELRCGGVTALVTGDLPALAEQRFAAALDIDSCDILVAGHHGAAGSTSAAFLRRTHPVFAVISVGEGNRYGHPADETLLRLEQANCTVLCTDLTGDTGFRLRRGALTVSPY